MATPQRSRPLLVYALSLCLLLTGAVAVATTSGLTEIKSKYLITSTLLLDGKIVSQPKIKTFANEEVTINVSDLEGLSELKMTMLVTDVSVPTIRDGIGVDMEMEFISGASKAATKTQIIVKPGRPGSVSGSAGEKTFELLITAVRE